MQRSRRDQRRLGHTDTGGRHTSIKPSTASGLRVPQQSVRLQALRRQEKHLYFAEGMECMWYLRGW